MNITTKLYILSSDTYIHLHSVRDNFQFYEMHFLGEMM